MAREKQYKGFIIEQFVAATGWTVVGYATTAEMRQRVPVMKANGADVRTKSFTSPVPIRMLEIPTQLRRERWSR